MSYLKKLKTGQTVEVRPLVLHKMGPRNKLIAPWVEHSYLKIYDQTLTKEQACHKYSIVFKNDVPLTEKQIEMLHKELPFVFLNIIEKYKI